MGIHMILSSFSNFSLEEGAWASGNGSLWLQTHIFKNREVTKSLIHRAERVGFKAIVVTIEINLGMGLSSQSIFLLETSGILPLQ